jgi:uncharacterized protein YciI
MALASAAAFFPDQAFHPQRRPVVTFFCKLLPPRAGFLQDMTPEEGQLMQEHAAYWKEWMGRGHVVAFGVVGDPAGVFGMGVVEFDSEDDARAFTDGDPTVRSGQGFRFEVLPMPFGVVRS